MSDERILKQWQVGEVDCLLWQRGERDPFGGTLSRGAHLVANVSTAATLGQDCAEGAIALVAQYLARPRGVWDLTNEPVTDLLLVELSGGLRGDEVYRPERPFQVADDLVVMPTTDRLRDAVRSACEPPLNRRFFVDLRGRPLYVLARLGAPREPLYAWDSDGRLQMCVALSRLVRPTSASFRYAARLIGRIEGERHEVRAGPVSGFGAEAFTATPERDWLTPDDLVRLRELVAAFDANPHDAKSRVGRAFWYFEYAARTRLLLVRWPLFVTALEALLNTGGAHVNQPFINRVPLLATALGQEPIESKDARRMFGKRSGIVHGEHYEGLGERDHALYVRMEDLLRETLRRAIVDLEFRSKFADAAAVEAAFPIPPRPPRRVKCPSCDADVDVRR